MEGMYHSENTMNRKRRKENNIFFMEHTDLISLTMLQLQRPEEKG